MPLYLDIHRNVGPIAPEDIAHAHEADMTVGPQYGVHYHQYWYNPESQSIFCLVEGPDRESCERVHREAHGLVADDIIPVQRELVQAFMGPLAADAFGHAITTEGAQDPGSRILLLTEIDSFTDATARMSDDVVVELMRRHDSIVRAALQESGGREVRHTGEGILACFASASAALRCALNIQQHCAAECEAVDGFRPHLRIGVAVGEPVEHHSELFGVCVAKVRRICEAAPPGEVLVSSGVREMASGKGFQFDARGEVELRGLQEPVSLFRLQLPNEESAAVSAPIAAVAAAAPRQPSRISRFVAELRRRRVITVAAAYAGVFYILLEIAQLTFEPLRLPDWTYTLLLILGAMGFPVVIVLTWIFDITPHGVERTEDS